MSELVRFETGDTTGIVVEVDETPRLQNIARDDDGVLEAGQRLDRVLAGARPTLESLLGMLRQLAPDECEVEFGIKLNAEAGVVVAKTATEGHFNIRMTWQLGDRRAAAGAEPGAPAPGGAAAPAPASPAPETPAQ